MEGNYEKSNQTEKLTISFANLQLKDEIDKLLNEHYSMDQFQEFLLLLQSEEILKKHKGIIGIRKILSIENNPPIDLIINSGIIPTMVNLMKQQDFPQLQREAAWIITNVASGTTQQCKVIVDLGVIPIFVGLLNHPENQLVQQAIWGIGNIASDCVEYRNAIIKAGGIRKFVQIANNLNSPNLIKHYAWALSSLCRSTPLPDYKLVAEAIPVLCGLIVEGKINDKAVLADCCWGISYHSSQDHQIDVIINSGIVPFLAQLLDEQNVEILIPALRTLGNISTGNAKQTDVLIQNATILPRLQTLLIHIKKAVVRETCWFLSNIAAGTKMQVDAIIKRNQLIHNLVQLFSTASTQVKRQVCYIFANICQHGNDPDVFNLMKEHSLLPCIVGAFESEDEQTINVALQCLKGILQQGEKNKATPENPFVLEMQQIDGASKLEKLQCHNNVEIYQKALAILETYFICEEFMN